jgi:hypothetical protein
MDRIEQFGGQTVRLCRDGEEWVSRIELSHFQSRRHGNAEAAFAEARRHIKAWAKEGPANVRRNLSPRG